MRLDGTGLWQDLVEFPFWIVDARAGLGSLLLVLLRTWQTDSTTRVRVAAATPLR